MSELPSVGGGVKAAVVDSAVVAGRVFRAGKVPEKPTFPYATFHDMIAQTATLEGDCDVLGLASLVQVDLWQRSKSEDYTLPATLRRSLNGYPIVAFQRVLKCKVVDMQEISDPDAEIVHHALTVRVEHAP